MPHADAAQATFSKLDAFGRRIVGWSMATTLATQLVLDALNMSLVTRRPTEVDPHSDHGSQYTSIEFGYRCRVRVGHWKYLYQAVD